MNSLDQNNTQNISDSDRITYKNKKKEEVNLSPTKGIEKLSTLKKAVIWSEILSKPLGLRDNE
jgi:hypothetical protein